MSRQGVIGPPGEDPPLAGPLRRTLTRRDRLYVHFVKFLGEEYAGEVAVGLCRELTRRLGPWQAGAEEVSRTVEAIMGPRRILDREALKLILLRIMTNRQYLERGESIPRWAGAPPVWSVVKVVDLEHIVIKDRPYVLLHARAMTGPVAGERHGMVMPARYVRWLAKELGYPRYERAHEREIVGMAGNVLLTMSPHGKVTISRVRPSSSQQECNRALARARLDKDCKYRTRSCCSCPMGLDCCGLACRQKTIERKPDEPTKAVGAGPGVS